PSSLLFLSTLCTPPTPSHPSPLSLHDALPILLHLQAGSLDQLVRLGLDDLLDKPQLVDLGYQRNHDLRGDLEAVFLPHVDRSGDDRFGLHLGDLRIQDVQTAAAGAQHRVKLVQVGNLGLELGKRDAHLVRQFLDVRVFGRQELMQRGIEQADGYRQAAHRAIDGFKVAALHGQDLGERRLALLDRVGYDHLAHRLDALGLEEHMLGTAQADAFRAELARLGGVARGVAVGADVQGADLIRPAHEAAEVAGQLRVLGIDLAEVYVAGRAIERDELALVNDRAVGKGEGL